MLEYEKLLKNKNEFQGIEKKISKLEYYLSRVEEDLILIRKQAEQVKSKSRNQSKLIGDKLESTRRQSQEELRKISSDLNKKILFQQENLTFMNQKLSYLRQEQLKNKDTIKQLINKITAIEKQFGN